MNSYLFKLEGCFSLIRPINCFMIGFAVIAGQYIALGMLPSLKNAALGFFSAAFLMASTMAMNDYYDLEIDKINCPKRPIPSGTITQREAIIISIISGLMGIIAAALINLYSLAVASFALILMLYYNTKGKKTGFLGNILVSICIGLPFIFGGAAVGRVTHLLILFSLMAFISNLGREVTKGIMDLEGDRTKKIKTIAVIHGPRKASILSAALFIIAVGVSFVPLILGMVSLTYIPFILISDIGFVSSSISLTRKYDIERAEQTKRRVLIWMFFGLLAFIAGGIYIK
ncbi:UbiA family prenyltransferase [[Eubacterium] cellulosolvens]